MKNDKKELKNELDQIILKLRKLPANLVNDEDLAILNRMYEIKKLLKA